MFTKNSFMIIAIGVLAITTILYSIKSYSLAQRLAEMEKNLQPQVAHTEIAKFTKLFIDKVLNAEGSVSFDTRLELENAVRATRDDELLSQWNAFVNSKTEAEAQTQVKRLLAMLVTKIVPAQ